MAVSRLRQWWGSRRLLRFAAGLTLLAITASPIPGITSAGPTGPFRDATVTAAPIPASQATHGVPLIDHGGTGRSAESVATVADDAPFGVLSEHLAAGSSPQRTAAREDALPLVGVAYAPSGLRAPPLRLV